jgi:hypothetical protein
MESPRDVSENTYSIVIRSLGGATFAVVADPDSINIFKFVDFGLYWSNYELCVPVPW